MSVLYSNVLFLRLTEGCQTIHLTCNRQSDSHKIIIINIIKIIIIIIINLIIIRKILIIIINIFVQFLTFGKVTRRN